MRAVVSFCGAHGRRGNPRTEETTHPRAAYDHRQEPKEERMGQMVVSVTIARPVEDVFRHFMTIDEDPADPDVESVTKTPEGPTAAGTEFHFQHKGGRETMMRYTAI